MEKPNFNSDDVEQSMLHDIASSFNDSGSYPDYSVTLVGHKTWLCHKMILTKRSGFFHDACASKFKEGGNASEINLYEADPHVLEAALKFCYTRDVTDDEDRANAGGMSLSIFYVRLFHLGEFYRIEGLTELAADEFWQAIRFGDVSDEQLAEAIQEVYKVTVDSERLLRKAVINKTLTNAKFFLGDDCPSFSKLAADEPDFAVDMMKAMASGHNNTDTPAQSKSSPVKETQIDDRMYMCPYCGPSGLFADPAMEQGSSGYLYYHHCDFCNKDFIKSKQQWRERVFRPRLSGRAGRC